MSASLAGAAERGATSDSIFLRKVPAKDAKKERLSLRRLQEVGVGVLAPAAELAANPVPDAVAVVPLAEMADAKLPEGAVRMAVSVRGDEPDAPGRARAQRLPARPPPLRLSVASRLTTAPEAIRDFPPDARP